MTFEPVQLSTNSLPSERLEQAAKHSGTPMHFAVPCLLLAGAGIGILAFSGFAGNPWAMMPAGLVGFALVALCPFMMGAMALWMWARGHKHGG